VLQPEAIGIEKARSPGRPGAIEWVLIAVVILYAGLLVVGPLVAIVAGSFSEGVAAFWREVTSRDALAALRLTLILSLAATGVNTVFGVCVALVLVRDEFRGRKLINGLVDLPFAVSPVVVGLMLILLFGRNGWLTPVTDWMGIKIVFAAPAMLLATIFVSLPFVIRELMPALQQFGTTQEGAAYTMGATPLQTFRYVTLPSVKWGLLYGVSLTFARAIGEFGALVVISGGVIGLTETSTLYIFRSLDDRNYVGADAMALVLAAISFSLLMLMGFFKKRGKIV
jgi:sulfate transport system permease protein